MADAPRLAAPLVLPQVCPVDGCLVLLQRLHDTLEAAGRGVTPHFEACHPGLPVPPVREVGASA